MKISKKKETKTDHETNFHQSIWFDYASTSLFPTQTNLQNDNLPTMSF